MNLLKFLPLPSGWNTIGAGILGTLTGVITLLTGVVGLIANFIDPTSDLAMDMDTAFKTIGLGAGAIAAAWGMLGIGHKLEKNEIAAEKVEVAVEKNTQAVKEDTAEKKGPEAVAQLRAETFHTRNPN